MGGPRALALSLAMHAVPRALRTVLASTACASDVCIASCIDGNPPDTLAMQVTAGGNFCQIDANGCATDGAGEHGDNEACTIQVNQAGYLTATEFDTESGYDYVTIGGARYEGYVGPDGVAVSAGSTFQWQSDVACTYAGWTICFGEARPHCSMARVIQPARP